MNYTLFLGCQIPARVQQYQEAAQAVLNRLDIRTTSLKEFMCCGYPMRNMNEFAFLLSAARNLALAGQQPGDLMVLCKCCYGSLKMAQFHLTKSPELCHRINQVLAEEGLEFKGTLVIKHFLSLLHGDIGLDRLKSVVTHPLTGLKIAASVGCHALRPAKITGFDSPILPRIFDDLVQLTGAQSLDWSKKSECCGAPLLGINDALSKNVMEKKLSNALEAGADLIAVACPYSFMQFDGFQSRVAQADPDWKILGPVLYPQLLGKAMGIDSRALGFHRHTIPVALLASREMA